MRRHPGRFKRADAASIAAHYGSVGVGTYAVAVAVSAADRSPSKGTCRYFCLAGGAGHSGGNCSRAGSLARDALEVGGHEVLLGKGIVLLLGGLLIGRTAG
ncbi:sodium-dependent bicarbonate transport family permease [Cryobacterium tagatosivorans]|uniref:sodium-dependent bicarbonate transport family permease n=1 Tax=Cryobacterium tagatosivorans TaxID=1259199 RepID=UPI001F5415CA|nr:sodium-dependent bicarbonate transport family permease [Cryobacterium tagatosivorans]